MGSKISSLCNSIYDSKRREFLGRDGARWAKLGIFYFFFYIGLAGFFCAMLAVFMAISPRDRPRYYLEESRMRTRSNPLSPGLGFRPQPDVEKNIIVIDRSADRDEVNQYARNLDHYLHVYYSNETRPSKKRTDDDDDDAAADKNNNNRDDDDDDDESRPKVKPFTIRNAGECNSAQQYGYAAGRPCVLVKMNKIVGFKPKPGAPSSEKAVYQAAGCRTLPNAVAIHCYGEYPADVDNLGDITYISENGQDRRCGALETKWFPYEGKVDRQDVFQAPYIWVQFTKPKPNVLINVICRVFGQNIDFDRKAGRALTRFQIYVKELNKRATMRKVPES